ncbi:PhzF family phenazine biosynthesis protein [Zavarzinia compransoris]|uniref:PhzF family phenazine biosynthesis protein n=1 Tax=Zavarzinia marina TaxID=2911065 RepID=UPI001F483CFF|nr:PhzF family phenazine biosynthesis protein [Zavarzinia marina]MCF4165377.1 PhzF family phenazine biosynthesis protein [Zavarzinia marina]
MTILDIFEVEAFGAGLPFRGNPAAVVPMDEFPPDATLQAIAAANNLPETAFFVPGNGEGHYRLRWFTPTVEVPLCGHATLASAFVIMTIMAPHLPAVTFDSASGLLAVTKSGDVLSLDFPARGHERIEIPAALSAALGAAPAECWRTGGFLMAVFPTAAEVAALAPNFRALAAVGEVIATAPGDDVDFVSRFFAPGIGIDEDPVTGAAHCSLTPFWAARLGKPVMEARQISARGGFLTVEDQGPRVTISGRCRLYLEGRIHI